MGSTRKIASWCLKFVEKPALCPRRWGILIAVGLWLKVMASSGAVLANDAVLGFEGDITFDSRVSVISGNWGTNNPSQVSTDTVIRNSGLSSVRIKRDAVTDRNFTLIGYSAPLENIAETVTITAHIKAQNLGGSASLWLQQYGSNVRSKYVDMGDQKIVNDGDWQKYSITVDLQENASGISFGVILDGTGTVWSDDFEITLGDQAVELFRSQSPAFLADQEFSEQSGISVSSLSSRQVKNLAILAKVWGFLKYHHPQIAGGKRNWDFELFRVLGPVLESRSRKDRNEVILNWLESLGPVEPCSLCAKDPSETHLAADKEWLSNSRELGSDLSEALQFIDENRFVGISQFYVERATLSIPKFKNENSYADIEELDSGFRLLAVFRYWNMIKYWSPHREIIEREWDTVLEQYIKEVVELTDDSYLRVMQRMVGEIHDSHAYFRVAGERFPPPPDGKCSLPVEVRFVEGRPIVFGFRDEEEAADTGLEVGDELIKIDGQRVSKLIREWTPYYSASNTAAKHRNMAILHILRGQCGDGELHIKRDGRTSKLKIVRTEGSTKFRALPFDRPGPTIQDLEGVAYIKLGPLKRADLPDAMSRARDASGLILDLRNYPSDYLVFLLGNRLVAEETEFVSFTQMNLNTPGTFSWRAAPTLTPNSEDYYDKPIAILVNEITQSSAEYHAMAFRTAPGAVIIGSNTAGADGEVTRVNLPGNVSTGFTSKGIFTPDRKPTQRIGLVPDIEVKPTIQGVSEGRDEVLEAAIAYIKQASEE